MPLGPSGIPIPPIPAAPKPDTITHPTWPKGKPNK